jgi:predicted TIM-barrel fold metal-dependent hydrolase
MPLDRGSPAPDAIHVIIDFHTHIFPPKVRDNREEYIRRDPTFAEMYGDPKAKIATAEDLLASMDESGVDRSVALGFAWQDHEDIVQHNEYLFDVAAQSDGALVPFATVNMADPRAEAELGRCAANGVRGIGELRPENQGWDLNGQAGGRLAALAQEHHLVLMFHVTEPEGHDYPGRQGCQMTHFAEFAARNSDLRIVGAHMGGGLYSRMPSPPGVFVDTAAQVFLYRGPAAHAALRAAPVNRLLFASDAPLIKQVRQIDEVKAVFREPAERAAILGGNAARLLGL